MAVEAHVLARAEVSLELLEWEEVSRVLEDVVYDQVARCIECANIAQHQLMALVEEG